MTDEAESETILAILRRLAAELAASTTARSWTSEIGLTSGVVLQPESIDVDQPPAVVIRHRRGRGVVSTYTTLRHIAHVELGKNHPPVLVAPRSLEALPERIEH